MNEQLPDQGTIRAEVLELINRKDQIEVEIRELAAILSQVIKVLFLQSLSVHWFGRMGWA